MIYIGAVLCKSISYFKNSVMPVPFSSCVTFLFYIKPQLSEEYDRFLTVVLHSYSTSNHNVGRVIG